MKMVIERWILGIAYFQAHPSCGRLMEHFMGIEPRIHGIFHLDIHGSTIFVHPENPKKPVTTCKPLLPETMVFTTG